MCSRDRHSALASDAAGIRWIRSSLCAINGSCLEAASGPAGEVWVRDSKDPGGGVLIFTRDQWRDFTGGVAAGQFSKD